MPLIVPPVPMPATKWVTRPCVCSQISGPVVATWTSGLAGLSYWLASQPPGGLIGQPLGHVGQVAGILPGQRGGSDDHLRAVGAQDVGLLLGRAVGDHRDHPVAALPSDDGQADAGVARGGLHDRATRAQPPVALGRLHHRQRGPVLDAAADAEELSLGVDRGREAAARAPATGRAGCRRPRRPPIQRRMPLPTSYPKASSGRVIPSTVRVSRPVSRANPSHNRAAAPRSSAPRCCPGHSHY